VEPGQRRQQPAHLHGNSHYVINVLSPARKNWRGASRAAAKTRSPAPTTTLSRTGQPILEGAAAWFECHNRSRYPEGDHVIFVGEVEECDVPAAGGLLFHGGRFGNTGPR
jgi:flavin reductase (DIM6/NTAB) family NADH-FMN oxidoreductase RutF